MEVDTNGIFEGINFWKFGCNWGSKRPSFYEVVKKHSIVLHTDDKEEYLTTDIILICEGHAVRALAQVNGSRQRLSDNSILSDELLPFDVVTSNDLYYYPINFQEIPSDIQFNYELQQGRIQVRDFETRRRASQLWTDLFLNQIDKRIMRLTWNSNHWETPSGHSWHPKNQGNSAIAYENQYGFGHEEWLFNERFRIDGFQYGYIRGVNNLSEDVEFLDQITLYTIRDDKQRCLVGNIHNVEIIEGFEEEEAKIEALIESYMPSMLDELKEVNADYGRFKNDYLLPNIKFKWEEADLFNEPLTVDFLDGAEFNRFQAYRLKEELDASIKSEVVKKATFDFQHGKASNTGEYTKSTSDKKTKVKRRHGEITDDLYDYLVAQGYKTENISVEKTRVGGAIVDVVLKHDEEFDLFEVKTSNTALKNIRQALGQIFEYALMDGEITCKRLVIIGPAELTKQEHDYFDRLKSLIQIKLEYWAYKSEAEMINKKFIIE